MTRPATDNGPTVMAAVVALMSGVAVLVLAAVLGTHTQAQSWAVVAAIVVSGAIAALLGHGAGRGAVALAGFALAVFGVPVLIGILYLRGGV